MTPVPLISDGVVTLRSLRLSDAASFAELHRDPASVRWTGARPDYTEADAAQTIEEHVPSEWASGGRRRFAVADAGMDTLLGTISLNNIHHRGAELGLKMTRSARGTGAAGRAVGLVLDYAFDALGLDVLHWYAEVGNWASRKLAYKSGFSFDGTVRSLAVSGKGRADCWVLSLARDDGRTPKGEWDGPALLLQPVVPLLRDGLVTLRQLAISDATQLELNWQDQSAHTAGTNPVRDQALYYIRSTAPSGWLNGTAHTFAAADTATDVLLGTIDLHDFRPGAAEIGLSFGPQARGRGMAEAAARAIIDYGFEQLNLQYLFWRTLAPNWASRKLAWKLGFRSEARIRGYGIENGEPADLCILSLAKEEPRSPQNPWEGPEPPRSAAVD